jgi:hypothetical protein
MGRSVHETTAAVDREGMTIMRLTGTDPVLTPAERVGLLVSGW